MEHTIQQRNVTSGTSGRQGEKSQLTAALQVFAGGACYGAMATTYKLAYAAGFTSAQVVASQAWFGCLFFGVAVLVGHARGRRWERLGPALAGGSAWARRSRSGSWSWGPSPASPQSSTATP